ncbi:ankyrin repeat domain-containing protein 27-like, partial [Exaiptasia diaphana]|uniref:Ankyrin n=1 Tax=Exaiptasia diaphana TaxID=2652724 RepID=A0A913WNX6_EXADI
HVSVRNMMNTVDEQGSTALHYAAQGGFLKNVSLLQQRWTRDRGSNKYSNRVRNHNGDLPLHLAARYGWIDVAKKLLQSRDFRQIDIANDHEKTPLHCAAEEGHSNMVAVLLDHQASVTK